MQDDKKTIIYEELRASGSSTEIPFIAFHEAQSLTTEEKTQARTNIGAIDSTYVDNIVGNINTILDEINGEVI